MRTAAAQGFPQPDFSANPNSSVVGRDDRNPLLSTEGMQAAGECPRHFAQMLVIQLRVVAVQVSPPAADAAAGLSHREKGVEDDAINAFVG
jgi:hypothetical protein